MAMASSSLGSHKPPKRLKLSKNDSGDTHRTVRNIEDTENTVAAALTSNASLNPLANLLHIASSSSDADVVLKAVFSLYRLFILITQKGIFTVHDDEDIERKTVRNWVAARLDTFADMLCTLLQDEEKTLRVRDYPSKASRPSVAC